MSVYRCYSEKRPGFDVEAQGLCRQLREQRKQQRKPEQKKRCWWKRKNRRRQPELHQWSRHRKRAGNYVERSFS